MKNKPNYKKLAYSILFDALGLLSFSIPMIGEFEDVVWAPISYWLMTRMYSGVLGKISGIISFIEEAIPGTDFIPTFTITWFIDNYYRKKTIENK
jgi:hypothetical protein